MKVKILDNQQNREKNFFSLLRELRESGNDFLDIGGALNICPSDQKIISKILKNYTTSNSFLESIFKYPSSWGQIDFRKAIKSFYESKFRISISEIRNVFPTKGSIDAWNTRLVLHKGSVVFPQYSPSWAVSLALMSGNKVIFAKSALNGVFDCKNVPPKSLIYVSNPICPTGHIPDMDWVEKKLIPSCKKNKSTIFVDSYAFWSGTFSFIQIPSFSDVGIEAISMSKEFMSPGLRIGAIVGSEILIERSRIYATYAIQMIPENLQIAASKLLQSEISIKKDFSEVENFFLILRKKGWVGILPKTHSYMLVGIPEKYQLHAIDLAYSLMKNHGVVMRPWFDQVQQKYFLEVILIQPKGVLLSAAENLPSVSEVIFEYCPLVRDITRV